MRAVRGQLQLILLFLHLIHLQSEMSMPACIFLIPILKKTPVGRFYFADMKGVSAIDCGEWN